MIRPFSNVRCYASCVKWPTCGRKATPLPGPPGLQAPNGMALATCRNYRTFVLVSTYVAVSPRSRDYAWLRAGVYRGSELASLMPGPGAAPEGVIWRLFPSGSSLQQTTEDSLAFVIRDYAKSCYELPELHAGPLGLQTPSALDTSTIFICIGRSSIRCRSGTCSG